MYKKIKNRLSLFYHLLAWGILFFLYVNFLQSFISIKPAILHTAFYLLYIAMVFYLHIYFLAPRLLKRKYVVYYILSMIALLLISVLVNEIYVNNSSINFSKIQGDYSPHRHNRYIISGTVSTIIFSYIVWFIMKYREQKQQKEELMMQKTSAELAMLKSQINPHFLFNTLNNIYAHSLEKAEPVVSEMILSLSEINRYMLYEADPDFVSLSKEIFYLSSYIELEKLRCENTSRIETSISDPGTEVKISPLLLITFIENAFKHSRIVDEEMAWIKIALEVQEEMLYFKCENSIPGLPFKKDDTKGIGLENVKRRLSLLYPDKHKLLIDRQKEKFIVQLKLQMHS